jgi:T5SS/PEP-CTERM-associated repeat protein
VINAGTISAAGGSKAVQLATGFANQVTIVPGAAFIGGIVDGGNVPHVGAVSALVLAAGSRTGTLTGLGSEYVDFGTLTVNHAASWVLGASTFQSGMAIVDNGTLTNGGIANDGATIGNFGLLINAAGGRITGPGSLTTSVYAPVTSMDSTLINSGYIGTPLNEAVRFHDGGSVTNTATGLITGLYGVVISGQTGTVTNLGIIETTQGVAEGIGVRLKSGGTLNNLGGTISGKLYGVYTGNNYVVGGPAFILNKATISGGQTGVVITNKELNTGGTLTNAGLIDPGSSGFAVRFGSGAGDELDIVPGARFGGGLVFGGNAIGATQTSLLRLNAAAAAGTLSGGSAVYEGFGAITVDPGATWTFAAGGTIFAGTTLTDQGTLSNFGTVLSNTTLTGTSHLTNASGGLLAATIPVNIRPGAISTVANLGRITDLGAPAVVAYRAFLSLSNQGSGVISGYDGIDVLGGSASIINSSTIEALGTHGYGVYVAQTSTGPLQVTNAAGHIVGFSGILSGADHTTVVNSGTIIGTGAGGSGVYVHSGMTAVVTNQSGGYLGGQEAVRMLAPSIIVENDDAIIGGSLSSYGVYLNGGSDPGDVRLTNTYGSIYGYKAAIRGSSGGETINNKGLIGFFSGASSYGVRLTGGDDVVTNTIYGHITGATAFVETGRGLSLVNSGAIYGNATAGIAVRLDAGGYVGNKLTGRISGLRGIVAYNLAPTTIRNAGLIEGGVSIQAGASDLVEIRPGSTVVGVVDGGNPAGAAATSTLELGDAVPAGARYGASPSFGILTELGSRYVDFSQVAIDANAVWSFRGQDSLGAGDTLTNNGFMTVDGQLLVDGVVNAGADLLAIGESGDGSLTVENGGTVVANGAGLEIGATDGIGAEVVVTGAHSLLNVTGAFVVGNNAAGELRIQAGGTVVSDTTGSVIGENGAGSSVQLTGAGSNWQITGALAVGQLASGALSVGAGSTVTATGYVAIGQFAGDGSSADVFGSGASLQAGGELYVGVFSSGVLSIDGGASVTAEFFTAGDSATAVGQVNLSGAGSSLITAADADIANSGDGGMSVSKGAAFSAPTLTVGAEAGASGAVTVSDDGSAITVTDAVTVGVWMDC